MTVARLLVFVTVARLSKQMAHGASSAASMSIRVIKSFISLSFKQSLSFDSIMVSGADICPSACPGAHDTLISRELGSACIMMSMSGCCCMRGTNSKTLSHSSKE